MAMSLKKIISSNQKKNGQKNIHTQLCFNIMCSQPKYILGMEIAACNNEIFKTVPFGKGTERQTEDGKTSFTQTVTVNVKCCDERTKYDYDCNKRCMFPPLIFCWRFRLFVSTQRLSFIIIMRNNLYYVYHLVFPLSVILVSENNAHSSMHKTENPKTENPKNGSFM